MNAQIIDGNKIARDIEGNIKNRVKRLKQKNTNPKLGVIYIGKDRPSENYINQKKQKAQELGIEFELFDYQADIGKEKIRQDIKQTQKEIDLYGLIIQLPIPERLYPDLLDEIKPKFDVDSLTNNNLGRLIKGTTIYQPPTAGAIVEILNRTDTNLKGKNVTVVGTGLLVGKPLANLLIEKETTLTTCNKYTDNLTQKCQQADIIISAVGKKHLIGEDMIKNDAIVIDTGIDYENGNMYGDVNFELAKQKASYITPTPGGVGPITVVKLLENVIKSAERQLN